jgi:hypothetical protein
VLDPFAGGGTTLVEAMTRGRRAVGCDLNTLATFVTRAKTVRLGQAECAVLREWADRVVPSLRYTMPLPVGAVDPSQTRNLTSPSARPLKKIIGLALTRLPRQDSAEIVARAAVLSAAQWALDGRQRPVSVEDYRRQLRVRVHEMLAGLDEVEDVITDRGLERVEPVIINDEASNLRKHAPFLSGSRADLVVTSPPYPGIHVLYHRWQVGGRRETPAPYWITAGVDGKGASHYTFVGRERISDDGYFEVLKSNLESVRGVMRDMAYFVQLVAFSEPERQLRRYLRAMTAMDFEEVRGESGRRIRRSVPSRKWHASQTATSPGAREVVLVHQAI